MRAYINIYAIHLCIYVGREREKGREGEYVRLVILLVLELAIYGML